MTADREQLRAERMALRRDHANLYQRVSSILFKADLIGINFETDMDEYEPEVGTILPRLPGCRSAADVQRVVHQEFCRWFDDDIAGSIERYEEVGREIWAEVRSLDSARPAGQ